MSAKVQMAAAIVDISPVTPVRLHASKVRTPYRAIADPLEANVMVFRSPGGLLLVLVTVDALSAGMVLRKTILSACPVLEDSCLLIGASHTHFAPALDIDLKSLGEIDPVHIERVVGRIADTVARLIAETGIDVDGWYGTAEADNAVNRRRTIRFPDKTNYYLPKKQLLHYPNPKGEKSETIHVVLFGQGTTIHGVLWSYGCHPVSFPRHDHVSADYVGVVRRQLRDRFGPIPVAFFQGFCGDVRPVPQPPTTPFELVEWLLYGPSFSAYTPKRFDAWADRLSAHVLGAIDRALKAEPITLELSACSRKLPIAALQDQPTSRPDIHFQRVGLSSGLALMSCSAEVTAGYRHHVHATEGTTIPIGYTDHVYGYLPTKAIQEEGGYEANGFRRAFDLPGVYVEGVEERVAEVFRSLQR